MGNYLAATSEMIKELSELIRMILKDGREASAVKAARAKFISLVASIRLSICCALVARITF